jgi:hypothetical protein
VRVLTGVESGAECVVEIDKPRRVGNDWRCRFRLVSAGRAKHGHAWGVDAVQALLGAFTTLRTMVDRLDERHFWVERDDHGFPLFIPLFYGAKFARKLEGLVTREVALETRRLKRHFDAMERRAKERPAPRATAQHRAKHARDSGQFGRR